MNVFQGREEQQKALEKVLSKIRHKVMVMSGKGGVGKSTIATAVALMLRKKGFKTGLMDVDLHGPDIPMMLGLEGVRMEGAEGTLLPLEHSSGLKVVSIASLLPSQDDAVIWRGPLKISAIRQFIAETDWGDLDFLIIDSPPGTGDEPLTVAQTIPGAKAVIVTSPQKVSVLDVRKSVNFCRKVGMDIIGLVENFSLFTCPSCGKSFPIFGEGGGKSISEDMKVPLISQIPFDTNILKSLTESQASDFAARKAMEEVVEAVTKSCK